MVYRILQPQGMLTTVTDNLPYATQLVKAFANEQCSVHKFSSKGIVDEGRNVCSDSFRNCTVLFKGDPSPTVGHVSLWSSYFDRLWQNEKKSKRYVYIVPDF